MGYLCGVEWNRLVFACLSACVRAFNRWVAAKNAHFAVDSRSRVKETLKQGPLRPCPPESPSLSSPLQISEIADSV